MIDKAFCMSSYLAFRYIEKEGVEFTEKYKYHYPPKISKTNRIIVNSANEIDASIQEQIDKKCDKKKIGILLSGGMDSSILASYFSGIDAYTFRFLGGTFQQEELKRAEAFARKNNHKLHYVDIDWDIVTSNLPRIMMTKGGPVHSIEPQIFQAALQAKADGIDLMIIGDASDYVFGGMDKLLSRDWSFQEFMKRFIYVDPFDVLQEPVSVQYLFERYRRGDGIDYLGMMDDIATQESYGSYNNAFFAADMPYFDPYELLMMGEPIDLARIRQGESKYLVRELFRLRYPDMMIPNKNPMPRPVDLYFAEWKGPSRPEFCKNIDISLFDGNQRWLMWCLEEFLNLID